MMNSIDYGLGRTNIDHKTGIRYGVIPANDLEWWFDESAPDFGGPTCPKCGNAVDDDCYCEGCNEHWEIEECHPESPLAYTYDRDGYQAHQEGDDTDVFVIKSPFYTYAKFCSPCAPGACHLRNPEPEGEKAYCFGHDWFDDDGAPYPVYRVDNDAQVTRYKKGE